MLRRKRNRLILSDLVYGPENPAHKCAKKDDFPPTTSLSCVSPMFVPCGCTMVVYSTVLNMQFYHKLLPIELAQPPPPTPMDPPCQCPPPPLSKEETWLPSRFFHQSAYELPFFCLVSLVCNGM